MQDHAEHQHEHGQGHRHNADTSSAPGPEPSHHEHERQHEHEHGDHHAHMVDDFRRRFWISLILAVPIVALSPMIQTFLGVRDRVQFPGDTFVLLALSSAIFFYGGWPFLSGLVSELRDRRPGMMTLISVAITTAYVYSAAVVLGLPGKMFFWELATLIVVMLLGHWIEMRSVMGASRALEKLASLMPSSANRVDDAGNIEVVQLDQLQPDDRVLVKPGEKLPADGTVADGRSSVNEAMLTGESRPVAKTVGDEVFGGSINGEGSLTVRVSRTGKESYLSQVAELVAQAQQSKSRAQNLANRAAGWLTAIALSAGAATFLIWWLAAGSDLPFALTRSVTVMVIACPHALGLAIPLVVAVSTSLSAKNGLLVRNRTAFESARSLDVVVFDKTGTLTEGSFGVQDATSDEVVALAAAVEQYSEHPIAKAIASAVANPSSATDFQSITGRGVRANVDGDQIAVVSPGYLEEHGLSNNTELPEHTQGKTVVFVLKNDAVAGYIALADKIRPESQNAIDRLHAMGVRTMMLTGDNAEVAEWVSSDLGLDDFIAGVLPDQKASHVSTIQSGGVRVAMVGDGINDAPALATADVGIAIGAGTDVAIEAADVVLVRSDPRDVAAVVELSRATYRKMVQNLWWGAGYNIVAIPLAAGVLSGVGIILSPAFGAALMSLSTVIVAINARTLRLPERT